MIGKSALLGFIVAVFVQSAAHAGNDGSLLLDDRHSQPILPPLLAGLDKGGAPSGPSEDVVTGGAAKSAKKAFLFSALVPGAGELYVGAKRGYVFLGVEIACWVTWVLLDQKGGDLRDDYEHFADEHWIENEYVAWTVHFDSTKSTMTHTLPDSRNQDYYEMIGKYDQFVLGWDDTDQYDPSQYTTIEDLGSILSPNRLTYEDKRYDSNKYLKRAGYTLSTILLNHVLSAIDAARSAKAQGASVSQHPVQLRVALRSQGNHVVPMLMASRRF